MMLRKSNERMCEVDKLDVQKKVQSTGDYRGKEVERMET